AATVPASPSPASAARTPLRVVQLTIPLDGVDATGANGDDDDEGRVGREEKVKKKKKVHRRDSLDRREALLRGKEGSRRRRRWENGMVAPNIPPTHLERSYRVLRPSSFSRKLWKLELKLRH